MKSIIASFNYSQLPVINALKDSEFRFRNYRESESYDKRFVKENLKNDFVNKVDSCDLFSKCKSGILDIYLDTYSKVNSIVSYLQSVRDLSGCLLNIHTGSKESAIISYLNSKDIPTAILPNSIGFGFTPYKNTINSYNKSKYVLCPSEFTKNNIISQGYDGNIIMTGIPYLDFYNNLSKIKRDKLIVLWGFEFSAYYNNTRNVYVPLHYPFDTNNYFLLCKVAEYFKDIVFVVKLKNWGLINETNADKMFNFPKNVVVSSSGLWVDYIRHSDLVVCSPLSSVVAESALFNVQILTADIDPKPYDYMDANIHEIEWNIPTICGAISKYIGKEVDNINSDFTKYHFSHNLDGKATSRVIDSMREIF